VFAFDRLGLRLQQDVGRLDVAVDDPSAVRRVQRRRDLFDDGHRALRIDGATVEDLGQGRAADMSHGDVEDAVRLAGLVHRDDVRMIQVRRGPRLVGEPLPERGVNGEFG